MNKWTATKIKNAKGKHLISSLTAYDYATACVMDDAGVQLILVGDSLAMTMLGYETTIPVTMEEMIHHASAVTRGVKNALVVADMPFMSYQISIERAIENAGRFIKKAGVGAVKIEGGSFRVPVIKALVENGIPVLGHIGLTPQSIHTMGGYRVQGKNEKEIEQLLNDAVELEKAGVFSIILECLPSMLGKEITNSISIPTIGIGAGKYCDGQILVTHDMLGLHSDITPKFAKKYTNLKGSMEKAFKTYIDEVEKGIFPSEDYSF